MAKNKKEMSIVKSAAAEYLTYVASAGEAPESHEMRYQDENIWLTQKMMAELYGVTIQNIGQHIKKILEDGELSAEATIKKYFIVQNEGGRSVERGIDHYNLQMIIAVGFKVENQRAIQFRKWAGQIVKDYTIQGWTMDVERIKKGHMFTDEYFERLLEQIREIRLSERKFYQKVTDIYSTAFDYDKTAKTTNDFFKKVQNKLHWAITGQTAAELIVNRVDSEKEYMGLTTWENAPDGKILKQDALIAKNTLTIEELKDLELVVSGYLDFAEGMARRNIPMSMEDWAKHLDQILEAGKYKLLTHAGSISAEVAKLHAETEYEKYRITQDKMFESDFDKFEKLQNELKDKQENN